MLAAPPEALVRLVEPWSSFYSDSSLAQTLVTFGHLAGLLIGGGSAIAADRNTFRALAWKDVGRAHHLAELHHLHRLVLGALTAVVITGLLLLTADLETYWGSWIYWVKMGLFLSLLVNGAMMQRAERALRADSSAGAPAWAQLRATAAVSIALWLLTTFAGVALLNFA